MAKRDRLSFDPEDPRIKQILHEIAAEYDIPPGDLLNAATIEYLLSILSGQKDLRGRLTISRLLRYGNRLDLDDLIDELKRLSGSE